MKTRTKLGLLVGLAAMVGLSMGTFYYGSTENRTGSPKVQSFTAATATAGETITDADGASYTWPTLSQVRFAIVQLSGAATGNLYCRINESEANASSSEWDFYLEPGQAWSGFADVQLGIDEITCFADAPIGDYGKTYIVKGCD